MFSLFHTMKTCQPAPTPFEKRAFVNIGGREPAFPPFTRMLSTHEKTDVWMNISFGVFNASNLDKTKVYRVMDDIL